MQTERVFVEMKEGRRVSLFCLPRVGKVIRAAKLMERINLQRMKTSRCRLFRCSGSVKRVEPRRHQEDRIDSYTRVEY